MSLLYKPDWEETKQRYKAWWEHEYFGRCAVSVAAPKDDLPNVPPPALPEKVEDRWLDFDYIHDRCEYEMSRTYYGGESFPLWNPGFPGCDSIMAFLGCEVELAEYTGWVSPMIEKGEITDYDISSFKLDPKNKWWSFAQKMCQFAAEDSEGKSIPACSAFAGSGDIIAGLRGSQNLLTDIMDYPEYVRDFDLHLMEVWKEAYNTEYEILKHSAQGSTCWDGLWSPGKHYALSNDFAYMISPKMFRDVFLSSIESQIENLDHVFYHVDGVGNFAHIDTLCELKRINAIQVLPGDGKPSPLYYMDELKKVQSAGKNLWIGIPPNEIEEALANLSARGLFIVTWASSQEHADSIIKTAEKYSRDI